MKNTRVIVPIITAVIGLGTGLLGGYEYRNYVLSKARANFGSGTGAQRFIAGRNVQGTLGARSNAVVGSILSMDSSSITVKMADGSTKIVLFSPSTTYSNTVNASQSDLKVGGNIAVFGTTNTDGTVTATNIQINPMFFRGPEPSPSPTP